ncbi:MAG TPA: hypothetical protein VJ464_15975 [Blastocatellia bacterium]|nr:hypothetical protein [Blastocatellia bacterium]
MSKAALKTYRKEIGDAWLPLAGRHRLTSHEYQLVATWFSDGTPLHLILKAIRDVAKRAKEQNLTVYSLGVIRADLVKRQRQDARVHVGSQRKHTQVDWRIHFSECLQDLGDMEKDESKFELLKSLFTDLPGLTKDEAEARLQRIYNPERQQ